jgi:four helix bundle protein
MPKADRLPHHGLVAYEIATELLACVSAARIADPKLRDQAVRAAKSACLNIAEAAGRASRADQCRVFTIARGEACEAAAAVEVAAVAGDCTRESSHQANRYAHRLVQLLTGLIRPRPESPAAESPESQNQTHARSPGPGPEAQDPET